MSNIYELYIPFAILDQATERCLPGYTAKLVDIEREQSVTGIVTYTLHQRQLGDVGEVRLYKKTDTITELHIHASQPPHLRKRTAEELAQLTTLADKEERIHADVALTRKIRAERDALYKQRKDFLRVVEEAFFNHLIDDYGHIYPLFGEKLEVVANQRIAVLFLAADPTDASRLRIGEEVREIREKLQLAQLRDTFILDERMSVRPADLSQALLDVEPQIVHFSGHGANTGELCFEDKLGNTQLVPPDALAALFEQFADQVTCVILNACYSEAQAKAIAQHINYVIGMSQEIGDEAAIAFAVGFYQGLGAGRTIEQSYKLGCIQIRLYNIPEHSTPQFLKRM